LGYEPFERFAPHVSFYDRSAGDVVAEELRRRVAMDHRDLGSTSLRGPTRPVQDRPIELRRFRVRVKRVDGRNDLAIRLLRGTARDENRRRTPRHETPFGRRQAVRRHFRRKHDEIRPLRPRVLRNGFVERMLPNRLTEGFETAFRDSTRERFYSVLPFRDNASPQRLVDHRVAEVAVEHGLMDEVEDDQARSGARAE